MKKIFFLAVITIILTTESYSQWWVDGGNLLWPYGDVNIKENLNLDGDLKVEGFINSLQYQHIIFRLVYSYEDREFSIAIYRNDTEATIDTAYFTGSPYPNSFLIEFSKGIINHYSQQFIYSTNKIATYNDVGFIPTQLDLKRGGSDNKVSIRFLDNTEHNPVNLFYCIAIIHVAIIPNSIIDQYNFFW